MSYESELKNIIKEWSTEPIKNEWIFSDFRENWINKMQHHEAFKSITTTLYYLILEKDESTSIEILQTIIDLAHHSNTTEIPNTLLKNKDLISKQFHCFEDYGKLKLEELFNYYRM